MQKFILSLIWIPFSACFLLQNIRILIVGLQNLIFYYLKSDLQIGENWEMVILLNFFSIFFFGWVISHLLLEFINFFKPHRGWKYGLKHLRFAPLATYFFALIIIPVFDFGMIQYSKFEINLYIYNSSQMVEKPHLVLHNDYRSFCLNANSGKESWLYYNVASAGLNDENPYVRSRSLLATYQVSDWFNGGRAGFEYSLSKSCQDESPLVRQTAQSILENRESSCNKAFKSNSK